MKNESKKQSGVQQPTQQKTTQRLQEEITDLFAQIKDEQNQTLYMRFYTQQEQHQYVSQQLFQAKTSKISLKLNKYINQVVTSLYILNGFVKDNSKSCTLLQTGKDIYQKKKDTWTQFLKMEEFQFIRKAFQCLKKQHREVLKFSIFIIANILLKLGINMSKLSMILVEKRHTSNYLSLPTLSVLFLQFLQFMLFQSKKIPKEDFPRIYDFLRQLPRITYIKICKYQNKQDLQIMQKGQQHLFSKRTRNQSSQNKQPTYKHKNIQYLQLYQLERLTQYQHSTNYKYIHSQNLLKKYGIKAPYSFELLFLFRYVYFDMINDFKPDLIFFVQEYPNDQKVIQARVRGFFLSQLMEKVGNRVFLMKQVGIYESYQLQEEQRIRNQFKDKMDQQQSSMVIEQKHQEELNAMQQEIPKQKQQKSSKFKGQILPLTEQRQQLLNKQEEQFIQRLERQEQLEKKISLIPTKQSLISESQNLFLTKMKYILLQDISYSALSLIQRTSFEQVGYQSRKHQYSKQFVQNVKKSLEGKIIYWKQMNNQELLKKLKIGLSNVQTMLKAMKVMQNPARVFCMYQTHYDYIYNLRQNRYQKLNGSDSTVFKYSPEDTTYVHYAENAIFVFIMNVNRFSIIGRQFKKSQLNSKIQYRFLYEAEFPEQLRTQHSIYIAAGQYLYKAFGVRKNGQGGYIYRLNYQKPNPQWQLVAKQCQVVQNAKTNTVVTVPLQKKVHGYGMYDQKNKTILFMGGYVVNCSNEEFVSKNIHIVRKNEKNVFRFGKTTNQIFLGAKNGKDRIPLYPFVYGFPFFLQKQNGIKVVILNTNGYMDNLPNNNRILLTQFKFSQNNQLNTNGVIAQHRMKFIKTIQQAKMQNQAIQEDDVDQQAICNRDQLLYYMTQNTKLVNRFENKCIFQTLEEGPILITIQQKEQSFVVKIKSDKEQISQFDTIYLKFDTKKPA